MVLVSEIGADKDYVHFLIQSTPEYSPSVIIQVAMSITARRVFAEHPEVKGSCGVAGSGAMDILHQAYGNDQQTGDSRICG